VTYVSGIVLPLVECDARAKEHREEIVIGAPLTLPVSEMATRLKEHSGLLAEQIGYPASKTSMKVRHENKSCPYFGIDTNSIGDRDVIPQCDANSRGGVRLPKAPDTNIKLECKRSRDGQDIRKGGGAVRWVIRLRPQIGSRAYGKIGMLFFLSQRVRLSRLRKCGAPPKLSQETPRAVESPDSIPLHAMLTDHRCLTAGEEPRR